VSCGVGFLLLYLFLEFRSFAQNHHTFSFLNFIHTLIDLSKLTTFFQSSYISIFLVLVAGALRINAQIFLTNFQQCTTPGVEAFVPLITVLWQGTRKIENTSEVAVQPGYFKGGKQSIYLSQDAAVAFFLAVANVLASVVFAHPRSTYVCDSLMPSSAMAIQCVCVILDVSILLSIQSMLESLGSLNSKLSTASLLLAFLSLVSIIRKVHVTILTSIVNGSNYTLCWIRF
jgi:hypothetical protein